MSDVMTAHTVGVLPALWKREDYTDNIMSDGSWDNWTTGRVRPIPGIHTDTSYQYIGIGMSKHIGMNM